MADPLSLLRHHNMAGKTIEEDGKNIMFGEFSWPKAVKTNFIVPVDLNSVMHMNYVSMAEFYSLLGDAEKAESHMEKAEALQRSILCGLSLFNCTM